MNSDIGSDNASVESAARRRECTQALTRDPAVWAWIVVVVLALLPLGTVLAGR